MAARTFLQKKFTNRPSALAAPRIFTLQTDPWGQIESYVHPLQLMDMCLTDFLIYVVYN
jgi:hypothetical protein